jgi:hypothetical protein
MISNDQELSATLERIRHLLPPVGIRVPREYLSLHPGELKASA